MVDGQERTRAFALVDKRLDTVALPEFIDKDLVAASIRFWHSGINPNSNNIAWLQSENAPQLSVEFDRNPSSWNPPNHQQNQVHNLWQQQTSSHVQEIYNTTPAPFIRPPPPQPTQAPPSTTVRICPAELRYNTNLNYIFYGSLLASFSVLDEKDCAIKCFGHIYCESANFFPDNSRCELNSDSRSVNTQMYKYHLGTKYLEQFKCTSDPSAKCGVPSTEPRVTVASASILPRNHLSRLSLARPHSLPWMATIQTKTTQKIHTCSAVLIGKRYLLTSASCFGVGTRPSIYQAILGVHKLNPPTPGQQIIAVESIKMHEGFNPYVSRQHDIALVRLKDNARLGANIQTICLPFSTAGTDVGHCLTAGWGSIGGRKQQNELAHFVMTLIPNNYCNAADWYSRQVNYQTMVCAGNDSPTSCQPDAGSPLMCSKNGTWIVEGVSSWGEGCARAKKPAVFTKIIYYLNWIRSKAV